MAALYPSIGASLTIISCHRYSFTKKIQMQNQLTFSIDYFSSLGLGAN